jgi:hypothetical protein
MKTKTIKSPKKDKMQTETLKEKDLIKCEIKGVTVLGLIYLSEYANMKIWYIIHNNESIQGNKPWELDKEKLPAGSFFEYAWRISGIEENINLEAYKVKNVTKVTNNDLTNKELLDLYKFC